MSAVEETLMARDSAAKAQARDLDRNAIAKRPTQKRALERFERVLEASEELLIESGLEGFSIPVLAARLKYTRGSVYAYFPSTHAIFNELAQRYLAELEAQFVSDAPGLSLLTWQEGIRSVVQRAVTYYNNHPAARLLILGGPVTDDSYRAQERTIKKLGDRGRSVLRVLGITLPRAPDVATLTVDIGVACFRRSVFERGNITPAYRDAASAAMVAFIQPYVDGAKS